MALVFVLGPVAAASPSENYGEYSLMTQRHAGQFYSEGNAAGQWSWTPQGDESEVLWGDPSKWPPDSAERFRHAGDWVLVGPGDYKENGYAGASEPASSAGYEVEHLATRAMEHHVERRMRSVGLLSS